jgi:hypothetical protein
MARQMVSLLAAATCKPTELLNAVVSGASVMDLVKYEQQNSCTACDVHFKTVFRLMMVRWAGAV